MELSIPYIIIENEDYDWIAIWAEIDSFLLSLGNA